MQCHGQNATSGENSGCKRTRLKPIATNSPIAGEAQVPYDGVPTQAQCPWDNNQPGQAVVGGFERVR